MSQMIEHAHKDDEVKFLADLGKVINRQLAEFYFCIAYLGSELSLREIAIVTIDRDDTIRAASFHFYRIKSSVAADIQHGLARQVTRYRISESAKLVLRIIAEEVIGRGKYTAQVEIVKPVPQLSDTFLNLFSCKALPIGPQIFV